MANKNLINIPIGQTGEIEGKWYEAQKSDFFGSCNCFVCDLHVPGSGCNNRNVVCYCPPRIFKETLPPYEQDYCYDDPIYDCDIETSFWAFIPLIIIIGIVGLPVLIYFKLQELIHKILEKWQERKK